MAEKRIGVAVTAPDSSAALAAIEDLEGRGFSAAWMTSGSASGGDSLSVFAAAAGRTQNIMLGTAITQIFPRHPIAVAQQVLVLAQLAPGRFRLGLGTSGRGGMDRPLALTSGLPWPTCGNTYVLKRLYCSKERRTFPDGTIRPTVASPPPCRCR